MPVTVDRKKAFKNFETGGTRKIGENCENGKNEDKGLRTNLT